MAMEPPAIDEEETKQDTDNNEVVEDDGDVHVPQALDVSLTTAYARTHVGNVKPFHHSLTRCTHRGPQSNKICLGHWSSARRR